MVENNNLDLGSLTKVLGGLGINPSILKDLGSIGNLAKPLKEEVKVEEPICGCGDVEELSSGDVENIFAYSLVGLVGGEWVTFETDSRASAAKFLNFLD